METRPLGKTGLRVPVLGLGTATLGEYGPFDFDDARRTVRAALDLGINFIDTSPYYGRGLSELLVGGALRGVPRDRYLLCTKLGRYDAAHFDYSPRRVAESVDVSLHRLGVEHLDVLLCHDIEFVDLNYVVQETLPALRRIQQLGKVRFVGVSGYPLKIFQVVLDRAELDVVLSWAHYTLQNRTLESLVPLFRARGVGVVNASPFQNRLLSPDPVPAWHKAPAEVKAACRAAAEHCQRRGADLAKLALQFAARNPDFACCLAGSASPDYLHQWVRWVQEPLDEALLAEVERILGPVLNVGYAEGRPENN